MNLEKIKIKDEIFFKLTEYPTNKLIYSNYPFEPLHYKTEDLDLTFNFENWELVEVNKKTNTERVLIDRVYLPKLDIFNEKLYINIGDHTIIYNPKTQLFFAIDTLIENTGDLHGKYGGTIRFFEDKLYCFRDYKIYLIENNSKKLFFEQPESKHQYHNIIDIFIKEDILKIIVSDGIIYTYSFKKLISTFETNIEISHGNFFLDGKCFCSDSDSLIIYIEKDSVWKIIFDEYSFDSCYISISNPVYEILFWDKLSLHLFDRNILKIIGEFICV